MDGGLSKFVQCLPRIHKSLGLSPAQHKTKHCNLTIQKMEVRGPRLKGILGNLVSLSPVLAA